MTFTVYLLFVVSIIFMGLYQLQSISSNEQSGDSKKLFSSLTLNDFRIHNKKIDDCNLERQYCYTSHDCFNRCHFSNKGSFECISGVCKLRFKQEIYNPDNDCDLEKGMAPFLVGIPELATVEAICKPVDLGIVYRDANDNKVKNKMCAGGIENINYMSLWPDPSNCNCGEGKLPIIIPATENVRQYVQCIKSDDVLKWVYDETNLSYHKLV